MYFWFYDRQRAIIPDHTLLSEIQRSWVKTGHWSAYYSTDHSAQNEKITTFWIWSRSLFQKGTLNTNGMEINCQKWKSKAQHFPLLHPWQPKQEGQHQGSSSLRFLTCLHQCLVQWCFSSGRQGCHEVASYHLGTKGILQNSWHHSRKIEHSIP